MAKQDYLYRYLGIIRKLKISGGATFEEISTYLERESANVDRPILMNIRTFQRDIKEILALFKIEISYDFSKRVYLISGEEQNDLSNRMIESIETLNTLNMAHDLGGYMIFERRKANGTQHFTGLLHAIRKRIVLDLQHQKFDDEQPKIRQLAPYALKESGGRWYLVARDMADRRIKTFGLDRVIDFQNTARRFDYPVDFDVNDYFRYSFGVINPQGAPPQAIVLSFGAEQGKYIKSYPLHESQEIISDDDKELVIRLDVWATYDLMQEILSYGDRVRVIAPESLKHDIASIVQNLSNIYRPSVTEA
jgi:predicted DNA-binding transcriptional regulator YafY